MCSLRLVFSGYLVYIFPEVPPLPSAAPSRILTSRSDVVVTEMRNRGEAPGARQTLNVNKLKTSYSYTYLYTSLLTLICLNVRVCYFVFDIEILCYYYCIIISSSIILHYSDTRVCIAVFNLPSSLCIHC